MGAERRSERTQTKDPTACQIGTNRRLVAGRENHRERLLHGALKCLREKGYAHTTTRDIAAASGANLGSIGHFGSKEALLGEGGGKA